MDAAALRMDFSNPTGAAGETLAAEPAAYSPETDHQIFHLTTYAALVRYNAITTKDR